jgi:large conductance mechanosensitive channel
MIKEFKNFIMRGNVLDLAIAVIIGGAFGKIITSLVTDIIMPLIGLLIGGVDFSGLAFTVGKATMTYGNFINNVINFLVIALVIFLLIKAADSFKKPAPVAEPVIKECPHCFSIISIKATRCPNCTSELK